MQIKHVLVTKNAGEKISYTANTNTTIFPCKTNIYKMHTMLKKKTSLPVNITRGSSTFLMSFKVTARQKFVLSYRFLYEKTVKCKMMSYSIIFPC
jgi:hypothetical protein